MRHVSGRISVPVIFMANIINREKRFLLTAMNGMSFETKIVLYFYLIVLQIVFVLMVHGIVLINTVQKHVQ
mgnify:CR=1 FL=1